MNAFDRDAQDRDIHRARLANLEAPEIDETADQYLARMVREHGTTYTEAARERYRDGARDKAKALAIAVRELARFRLPRR